MEVIIAFGDISPSRSGIFRPAFSTVSAFLILIDFG
jgi:hypothetical protein